MNPGDVTLFATVQEALEYHEPWYVDEDHLIADHRRQTFRFVLAGNGGLKMQHLNEMLAEGVYQSWIMRSEQYRDGADL
jgi:hypothetical protein